MTANTRHVPGSIRSRRSVLSRSTIPFRRFQTFPEKSVQNPYKSDHFRKCEFFTPCASITYNFNALKCTDFPAAGASLRRRPHFGGACSTDPGTFRFLLPRGEGQDEGQTGNGLPFVIAHRGKEFYNTVHNWRTRRFVTDPITLYQPLTRTRIGVRRFSRPFVAYVPSASSVFTPPCVFCGHSSFPSLPFVKSPANQNRQNRRMRRFSTDSTTPYQALTTNRFCARRFCHSCFDILSSFGIRHLALASPPPLQIIEASDHYG